MTGSATSTYSTPFRGDPDCPATAALYDVASRQIRQGSVNAGTRLVLDVSAWEDLPDPESDDWIEVTRDLQSLADGHGLTLCVKSQNIGETAGLEIEPYGTALVNLRRPPLAAMPSLGLGLGLRLAQSIAVPTIPWSPTEAFFTEGDQPRFLIEEMLELKGLTHLERLHRIDEANKVFQFNYGKSDNGKYYKIPLIRNRNVEPDDIKIKISKKEYLAAMEMIDGAGRLQRITRAVRYLEIYQKIVDHLAKKQIDLADIVVIGVDSGGRLPATLVKHALGSGDLRFLKVNQGRGDSGNLDEERLEKFAAGGLFKGKYLVFVDSTVDSGRQIEVLRRYFSGEINYAERGHKGWVVVGSNENGETLGKHHLNINWGVDPDDTFEDNPDLLGMDYDGEMHRVRVHRSEAAHAIRHAFAIVPQGSVLRIPPDLAERKARAESARKSQIVADSLQAWLSHSEEEPAGLDLAPHLRSLWVKDVLLDALANWNPADAIDAHRLEEDDDPRNYSLEDIDNTELEEIVHAELARQLGTSAIDPELMIDSTRLRARPGLKHSPESEHLKRVAAYFDESSDKSTRDHIANVIKNIVDHNFSGSHAYYPVDAYLQLAADGILSESAAVHLLRHRIGDIAVTPVSGKLFRYFQSRYRLSEQDLRILMHHQILADRLIQRFGKNNIFRRVMMNYPVDRLVSDHAEFVVGNLFDMSGLMSRLGKEDYDPLLGRLAAEFESHTGLPIMQVQMWNQKIAPVYASLRDHAESFSHEREEDGRKVCLIAARLFIKDWQHLEDAQDRLSVADRADLTPLLAELSELRLKGHPEAMALASGEYRSLFDMEFYRGLSAQPGYDLMSILATADLLLKLELCTEGQGNDVTIHQDRRAIIHEMSDSAPLKAFADCSAPVLIRTARLALRHKPYSYDVHGTLGTAVKKEFLAEVLSGDFTRWPELRHHYENILLQTRTADLRTPSRETEVFVLVAIELAPVLGLMADEQAGSDLNKLCAQALDIVEVQFSERHREEWKFHIPAFVQALSRWPEKKRKSLDRTVRNLAMKTVYAAIEEWIIFHGWDEVNAYLQKNFPGLWIRLEVPVGTSPGYGLRDIYRHVLSHRKTPAGITSGTAAKGKKAAAIVDEFLLLEEFPDQEPHPLPHHPTSAELYRWVHSHGTLAVKDLEDHQFTPAMAANAIKNGSVAAILEKLSRHWGKIIRTLPAEAVDTASKQTLFNAALLIAKEIANTYRLFKIELSSATPFLAEAFPELAWRVMGSRYPRNWNDALTDARKELKWGVGFPEITVYNHLLASGKPLASLESGFAQVRAKIWAKHHAHNPAPMPGEDACAALLAGAAMNYEDFTTVISLAINLPPTTSYQDALSRLLEAFQNLEKAYLGLSETEKTQNRAVLLRLIHHVWAEAYATGYSHRMSDDLRQLTYLQARLLIGDVAGNVTFDDSCFSDGRIVGYLAWGRIQSYVENQYPSLRIFERLPGFVTEIFSLRSPGEWHSVTIGNDPRTIFMHGI